MIDRCYPVLNSEEMRRYEQEACSRGESHESLMEKAAGGIATHLFSWMREKNHPQKAWILAGRGNNGGDGFAAARILHSLGVATHVLHPHTEPHEYSPLCLREKEAYISCGGTISSEIHPILMEQGIIVDALFGTGFRGELPYWAQGLLNIAQSTALPIFALDVPSGLNGTTGEVAQGTLKAQVTLFIGAPKLGCFLRDAWNYSGHLTPIPLLTFPPSFSVNALLITKEKGAALLPQIHRNRHKYGSGHVVGVAGSKEMPGAAVLASIGAFRGGAGMVHLLHPCDLPRSSLSPPYELITTPFENENDPVLLALLHRAGSVFIGPGMGKTEATEKLLEAIVPQLSVPAVLDADALWFLSTHPDALPRNALLTPHHGEMARLLSTPSMILNDAWIQRCQSYAEVHHTTILLKGAPSLIFSPGCPVLFNPTGDPGMATAGTGDLLTGILSALLASGMNPRDAATLGAYVHGRAGEKCAAARGISQGMIASDLCAWIAATYSELNSGPST